MKELESKCLVESLALSSNLLFLLVLALYGIEILLHEESPTALAVALSRSC
jgi:hypothetical protein